MSSSFVDALLLSYKDADLSASLVSKAYRAELISDTLQAMELARGLGIRVPTVKRIVHSKDIVYLIMNRIDGMSLNEARSKLGWIQSIRLAVELRGYIHALRSLTSSTAGSLATGKCRSFWLDDIYRLPQKSTPADLSSFLLFWTNFTTPRAARRNAADPLPANSNNAPSTTGPFVFTHHDLAPRNILLDTSGRHLWLVDWDIAGYYPRYFEYAAIHNFIAEGWSWFTRARWMVFTWIAAGRWEKERRVVEQIRSKFTRFGAGRRFYLLKHGGPSGRSVVD
ncbi:hypothetical protein AJ79_05691 [Helicocarpus griseus UAMH5409]|uniref:Aminoglycoside phosphotransferase domain-containing protein n=1 Tax=Helicocarpus griseus UAMH5409 TaxID=1447875 RepID=A0A2B7XKB7_9EURO|nr:hypothetical protein AJ79_05691 [Helicocarpus griseus UAMH5409]